MKVDIRPEDRIGEIYGSLKIIGIERDGINNNKIYVCECVECGRVSKYTFAHLKQNHGCKHIGRGDVYVNRKIVWGNKRIKSIYSGMKNRCYNKNYEDYPIYGGKGVKIYKGWLVDPLSFENWALNNGYEDGLSIDRIDSNGNYCPENCRWITLKDNAKYKSTTGLIDVDGEIHTGHDWATILDFGTNMINNYIRKYGMENTVKFIKKFKSNPDLRKTKKSNQSYYSLYMK